MATVRTKKIGTRTVWLVNHCKDGKRWPQETFRSAEAARKRRLQIEKEEELGVAFSKKDSITFSEAARAFVLDRQKRVARGKLGPGGAEGYENKLEYVLPDLGSILICKIEKKHVQDAIDKMQDDGYAARTIGGMYGAVMKLLDFAVDQGWSVRNIVRDGEKVELPEAERVQTFTPEEAQALIDAANVQSKGENLLTYLNRRALVYLGLEAGVRPGESFGLQWADLNFETMRAHIRHSNTRHGFGPTKTRNERYVGITPAIYTVLSDIALYWTFYDKAQAEGWRSYTKKAVVMRLSDMWSRRHEKRIEIPPREGFIIRSKTLQPYYAAMAGPLWKRMRQKAGLVDENGRTFERHSLHKMRHWNISLKLMNGVPLPLVSQEAGHADASVTLGIYSHVLSSKDSSSDAMASVYQQFAPRQLPPPEPPRDFGRTDRELSDDEVREVRARLEDGEGLGSVSRSTGISQNVVRDIRSRRAYGWVE